MAQKRDPRIDIIFTFLFALIVATSSRWSVIFLGLLTGLGLAFASRLSLKKTVKQFLLADLFLLMVVITLPFTTPGQGIARLGPLILTREGLLFALFIFLKANSILLVTYALLGPKNIFEIAHALHHLKVPSKLVQLLFFTFRYLSLLEKEFQKLLEAAKLRGFSPKTALSSYRVWSYLLAALFIRSYDRASRVYEAMLLRGYRGYFPVWHHFAWQPRDTFWSILGGIYLIFMASLAYL